MNALRIGLVVTGSLACTTPVAQAATTVSIAPSVGAAGGAALSVTGDRHANDITITLSRARVQNAIRTRFKVVDRRARMRANNAGQQWGCRVRDRHTVVCATVPTSFAYVSLGAGDDRVTVKTAAGVGPRGQGAGLAPDWLHGIPQDEGMDGEFLGWRIDGGDGKDRIVGSPFFDHIIGGRGSDVLHGRGGEDLFDQGAEPGRDAIFGGAGRDTLAWSASTPLSIDLGQGTFTGGTVKSIEKVRGGAGNDRLIGSNAPDMLQGAGGADAIAGMGGADLLIGDGAYAQPPAADLIDGGTGDDLLDLSNRSFNPYGPSLEGSPPGPPDRLACGAGGDRVDTLSAQLVPADCEGARFQDGATTLPLRPTTLPDGSLVYDVACPARKYFGNPVTVCDGTLTLTRPADGSVLGASPFSLKGGTRIAVTVKPAPALIVGEAVGVQIKGAFDKARPDPSGFGSLEQFEFGWAITL